MKFCTKCGAELFDDAVICTKCGRIVESQPVQPPVCDAAEPPDAPMPEKKPSSLLVVSNFVHRLLAAFVLFFSVLGVACGSVYSYGDIKSGYYSTYVSISSYFYPNEVFAVLALIFAIAAFIFGILSFVLTLSEKHKGERLFSGIGKLIISVISLLGSILFINL